MHNLLPNQTIAFTYPGYVDEENRPILALGTVKGYATTGVPVLGRTIIVQPIDDNLIDIIRSTGYHFDCIAIFENQIQ